VALAFRGPSGVPDTLHVNGRDVRVWIEPHRTLLSVQRQELGLTGAKRGCGQGQRGFCTAGQAVYTHDVPLPGMLIGPFLRSPRPHAHIPHIDSRAAESLPGVWIVRRAQQPPRG
jgi:aldehyde oxidase/xanthine dehydrogenase-like protein